MTITTATWMAGTTAMTGTVGGLGGTATTRAGRGGSRNPGRGDRNAFRGSVRGDSQRGVDLVAQREAAGVRIGLGGVEAIHHVRVADSVFQIHEPE
jgi:hypothetical protein